MTPLESVISKGPGANKGTIPPCFGWGGMNNNVCEKVTEEHRRDGL